MVRSRYRLTGEEVANSSIFSSDNFSLLIIPTGSAFPAAAVGNLMDFLSSGGQMFTCGGYAFDDPVCRRGGAWTALKACAAPVPAGTDPVALPAASSWGRSTSATSKTVVRDVCRWWADQAIAEGRKGEKLAAQAILDVLDTPVSPELLPSKRGKIVQRTEDRIGPYELHDFFIWHTLVGGERRKAIRAAALRAFKGRYTREEIDRWLEVYCRRLVTQAFKRNCAPDGIKVFPAYFGPDDWHIPSDTPYRGDVG